MKTVANVAPWELENKIEHLAIMKKKIHQKVNKWQREMFGIHRMTPKSSRKQRKFNHFETKIMSVDPQKHHFDSKDIKITFYEELLDKTNVKMNNYPSACQGAKQESVGWSFRSTGEK